MRQAIIPDALKQAAAATGFSPAIRAGDFLFLTGATGGRADGTMPDDAADQTRVALDKVQTVLVAAGAGEGDVVEMTSYHLDIANTFAAVQGALEQIFAPPLPAWTAVEVAGLRRPGALVEFRVVAHAPEARAP
ncbi:Rid family hydrolase [Roseobacter sinensis]|uniref:Rid family hydrolase n=1 Tax=Roseobacter sinensis TaxID=2931391 RepID=A0ABT3BHF2_9RHOB|nr:Rid family hydrolase [Roseobacter sp. WL0113]MCV3273007.1 Rid family hydrolase [Roseobacter sp. WL0113]